MVSVAERAKALAESGFAVFAVRADKTPYASDGLKSASLDPFYVQEVFEKYGDKAYIGIHCGMSGIVVLDLDYKTDADGTVLVDGFDSLDRAWVDVPESFSYDSLSGNGKHIMYVAPEGKHLSPKAGYRKMSGVDRRAGESYVVFTADTIPDKATFVPAPEWLCEESQARSVDAYTGTVKDWYETLEAGEPNLLVRRAVEDAEKLFERRGDDFSHSDVIELQHRAVRLGAEGNPGVPALLERIEEMFMSRTGAHSREEDEWPAEFAEGLASGIQKHGAAIDLRKNLPAYDLSRVPAGIPDRLLTGAAGNKETFRELLATAAPLISDNLELTSLLWNSPRTRDISREWGLIFTHERVKDYRERPEPIRENPSLAKVDPKADISTGEISKTAANGKFLSAEEEKIATETPTFIDAYVAGTATKGFWNPAYAYPSAWTALSMAFGCAARIPLNGAKGMGVNLWFIPLGYSGTGKTSELHFLKDVLAVAVKDEESHYNLGAASSPQGLHESLLNRDMKPSMVLADEAASFFSAMMENKWARQLEYDLSNYYMGDVEPSSKVRLKELAGKSAKTSFNMHMTGTPDRVMELVTTEMFETGFTSRINWTWSDPPVNDDYRFEFHDAPVDVSGTNPVVYELGTDLAMARYNYQASVMKVLPASKARVATAFKAMVRKAQAHDRWEVLDPAMTRLGETIWKCAGLTALYDGRSAITVRDTLIAIHYATEWFHTLIRVVESTSESEFSREVAEIEAYVKAQGGSASEAKINHRFRGLIRNSSRELTDRIDFLRVSGRLIIDRSDNRVVYRVNE